MQKAIGYVRVSTEEQQLGPVAQEKAMRRWCQANDTELVAVFTDNGVSGGAELDKRPALLEAIDALKPNGATALLVAKRDRLARDVFNAAMIEGARVMAADGAGNGDGPENILFGQILDAFAQYERAVIRARTKNALAVKKSRQEKTGGKAPYGYHLAADGIHLEPDTDEQAMIALARELKAAGLSLRKVGERLAAAGYLPRTGGQWHAETVKALLKAEVAA
jgi:DNA invertase Pin-like site-specific DNA recombinase